MRKLSRAYLIVLLASTVAMAQNSKTIATADAAKSVEVQEGTVVIQTTPTVIKQPTTVVEATPLSESKADQLRRQRQGFEVDTEQKIVEKLEQSRLEDERNRADRIFGNKLEKKEEAKSEVAPVVVKEPVQTLIVQPEEKKVTHDDLNSAKSEIIEAIKSIESKEAADAKSVVVAPVVEAEKSKERYYISAALGRGQYKNADNVDGRGAGGFLVGVETGNNFVIEGGLIYSNYMMQEYYWRTISPIFKEFDQYDIGLNVKYSPLAGKIRPLIGAGMSYVHRKYFDRLVYGYTGLPTSDNVTSNAVNVSFLIGADLDVSNSFSIGLEYRYSANMIYRSDSDILGSKWRADGAKSVEETPYDTLMVNGKIRF